MDILFASLIFVGLFVVILILLSNRVSEFDTSKVFIEAKDIDALFEISDNNENGFISPQGVVDPQKLREFANLSVEDYDALKRELGLDYDFCIFFEDESGNLKPIVLENGSYLYALGDSAVVLPSAARCGEVKNS